MLTEKERETALALLTRSRQVLLDTVEGVSENQAHWKPGPERWSILEYVEHLAVGDDALVNLVRRSLQTPAHEETAEERRTREQKVRETVIPRGVNNAPERLRPNGRFGSLQEAVQAFLAARERTIVYATTTQEALRSHFAPHPVLGQLDGYQWLAGNARHAETHAGHIREIQAMDSYPKQ